MSVYAGADDAGFRKDQFVSNCGDGAIRPDFSAVLSVRDQPSAAE